MFKNPFILFGLTVLLLLVFLPSYQKMQDLRQTNDEYQHKMHALVQENILLTEEKMLLETDPAYLEKVARERMGLIREGEIIYRIMPVDD
jgi:cell division protein DivIC